MGSWREDKTRSWDQSFSCLPLLWRWERGRLILHSAHKRKSWKPSVFWGAFFAHLCQWLSGRCSLKEGTVLLHAGCLTVSVSWGSLGSPGMWCGPCTAGVEKQDGSTAGGLPPASLLLKGRAVAIGLAIAGCSDWGPALPSVLHCLCCIDRSLWSQHRYRCHDMMGRFSGGAAPEA